MALAVGTTKHDGVVGASQAQVAIHDPSSGELLPQGGQVDLVVAAGP